jgi:putative ABC transport system permease protein
MTNVLDTVRDGLRSMRKSFGLTVTILLTLALGIGANTAIFTVDYATLLAPLPYREPDRLVEVWSKWQDDYSHVAAGDYRDWTQQATSFQDLQAVANATFNIATRDQPELVAGHRVTVGYYGMLGQAFALGRDFLPEEGQGGKDHVVILTHQQWQSMGANPHVVGTTVRMDGEPYTVVGVLAAGVPDRALAQLIVPLVFTPEQLNYSFHWLTVRGRLKPGVTVQQARTDMDAVSSRIADLHPERGKGWGTYVDPFKNDWLPDDRGSRTRMLWLLMGGVGFVLLIACVNIINLLLAKNATRRRELAVRGRSGQHRA